MIKNLLLIYFLLAAFAFDASAAKFPTPGTGVNYNLDSLVANSNGVVTLVNGDYLVNDTVVVALNDTLTLTENATIKFAAGTFLWVNGGSIIVNPSNQILLTAQDNSIGFLGVRVEEAAFAYFKNMTFEYAVSFRLVDCNPYFENCIFQYNNMGSSTTFGNGAMVLFRSNPILTNCSFLNNRRAAIQGGANINNAPKIYNSLFKGNNTLNVNVPQINLGATSTGGTDTVKIINSQIIDAGSVNAGGIGFLPIGEVYAVIEGNTIRNNRYGITFNGGQNINALVGYNIIDSNNIQGNPNLGGSGISFTGGSASSVGQNTIVYHNIIRANLWGITIQNRSRPQIGDLSSTDTLNHGNNQFINNTNTGTPGIDLYNNSPDMVMAQNNYWNTDLIAEVEQKIFHKTDSLPLGLVMYEPFLTSVTVPVKLKQFNVFEKEENAIITWQTLSEENSSHFEIEKSFNGAEFFVTGKQAAAGNSNNLRHYEFIDKMDVQKAKHFYRLAMVDKDGSKTYSPVRILNHSQKPVIRFYPNPAKDYIVVNGRNIRKIVIVNMSGNTLIEKNINDDQTIINISTLSTGHYLIKAMNEKGEFVTEKIMVK